MQLERVRKALEMALMENAAEDPDEWERRLMLWQASVFGAKKEIREARGEVPLHRLEMTLEALLDVIREGREELKKAG